MKMNSIKTKLDSDIVIHIHETRILLFPLLLKSKQKRKTMRFLLLTLFLFANTDGGLILNFIFNSRLTDVIYSLYHCMSVRLSLLVRSHNTIQTHINIHI